MTGSAEYTESTKKNLIGGLLVEENERNLATEHRNKQNNSITAIIPEMAGKACKEKEEKGSEKIR